MSSRMKSIAAVTIGSAVIATAAATFAIANIANPFDTAAEAHDEVVMPAPTTGPQFWGLADCVPASEVLEYLIAEREGLGGETLVLARGLDQAFADAWRAPADIAPVEVSSIVAHAFADAVGNGVTVDVVEFDRYGCALSRTLLSGDDWNAILTSTSAVPAA